MKKLRIRINNKVYEVEVEILEDDEGRYPGTFQQSQWKSTGNVSREPTPPTDISTEPKARQRDTINENKVLAPIVGTVTKILVKPGDEVEENQPLIVLDAMKMDTYVNSPRRGVIKNVLCSVGDNVQVGQMLVTFR